METDNIHLRMMGLGGGVGTKIGGGGGGRVKLGALGRMEMGGVTESVGSCPLLLHQADSWRYEHRWFSDKYGASKGALDPPIKMRSAQS